MCFVDALDSGTNGTIGEERGFFVLVLGFLFLVLDAFGFGLRVIFVFLGLGGVEVFGAV